MNISEIHKLFLLCTSVSIDTRKVQPKSMFIAIKGPNFDANTFAVEALAKGSLYVIIDNKNYYIDNRTILVNDSLETLQALAKFHRKYLNLPILALTGSNGKTTTKELIYAVLSKKFNTKATNGNLNNHIGVPLTILSFNNETELGIVEMGANHQEEIEFLCELATPDYGYITNFGKAHLEGFGGVEGVIKGKSEMYNYILSNDKVAFINLEDRIQVEKSSVLNSYTFGVNKEAADVNIQSINANPFVTVEFSNFTFKTHLIGLYNGSNVNAALAIGKYFEVDNLEIKDALETYVPDNNRSQLLSKNTNQIILDAYNANPSSMVVAIENFLQLENSNKILVLGDMFELGEDSFDEHKVIVNMLIDHKNIDVYFVGNQFHMHQYESDNVHFFETFETFSSFLGSIKVHNALVLIKGSRGMALERTLQFL